MAPPTSLPYGIRDCKLTKYTDASGTILDTVSVDLPNMQTFSFSEAEEFQELRGDDRTVAIRGKGSTVDWELDSGGMDFQVWGILTGGTIAETGLTPNRIWTLQKRSTATRPYFRVEGKSISDSGGDMHANVFRCRANDTVDGSFSDGEFFLTQCKGVGLPLLDDVNDLLYEFVQNETPTAIPTTPVANPSVQLPPTTLAAGSPTATTLALTWVAAANGTPAATDYKVQRRVAFGDWVDITLASPTTTGGTATGLTTATQYQFRVRAMTAANGTSDWSNIATGTTS